VPPAPRLLLPPLVARAVAFVALGAFGAVQWAELVRPNAAGRMLAALGVALVLGLALLVVSRRRRAVRVGVWVVGWLAALLGVLAAAGAAGGLLAPAGWGALVDGVRQGFQGLAEVRVPYDGADPWPAVALLLAGGLLLLIAGAVALRSRGRMVGLLALGVLYAVPAIDVGGSHELLRGAAFALLLAAFLWLDRIPARGAPAAGMAVAVALGVGLALAPGLDRGRPWLDYQAVVRDLASAGSTTYDFDHRYGPLDWPRNGQELLRIAAPREAYWKAEDLDQFDGTFWQRRRDTRGAAESLQGQLPDSPSQLRRWGERLRVTVRGLRTDDVVAAGTTLDARGAPTAAIPAATPGTLHAESTLTSGDSYVADVYFPRPGPRELARAGTAYPSQLGTRYLTLSLPIARQSRAVDIRFGAFGSGQGAVTTAFDPAAPALAAARALRDSPYAPAYALARRLSAHSRTPYEVVQRILAYFAQGGFVYSENPRISRYPLKTFLFGDRAGYCQHFSGAMALLLRMAGVPARVAGGFSPGTYDRRRHEWVVRDYDAHSWVEAYFPGTGWVTFDPTPADSPARSQLIPVGLPANPTAPLPRSRVAIRGDRPEPGGRAAAVPAPGGGGGAPTGRIALAAGLLALAALAAALLATGGAGRRRATGAAGGELAELERALRRAGLAPAPPTTLRALERRNPEAGAYLRTLADRRFGFGGGAPTTAQRRALRRALARSAGRLRALWALPPRPWRRPLH
jgi:transglutaminase-like putative cysteine protease